MRILIAGASGLIGRSLVEYLGALGHDVHRLVRGVVRGVGEIPWAPQSGQLAGASVEGFDAAICLSGAGIADAAWTPERKAELRKSRVDAVRLLAGTLAECQDKPECLICASASGIYGFDRGVEVLTEDSTADNGFLGRLCFDWEAAAGLAQQAGIRVVNLRFGIVLSPEGGVLKKMFLPFKLGLGGRLGNGKQFMSWVSRDDAIGIIDYAIHTESLEGPVIAAAPIPVTNSDFTYALGRVLHRPTVLRVPELALRVALGEMSQLLLGSLRMYPRKLEAAGYRFRDPEISEALKRLLSI